MKCSDCGFWKSEECTTNLDWVDFNYAENFACFTHKDDVVEVTPEEQIDEVITDRYGTPVPMGWNWGAFVLWPFWVPCNHIPFRYLFKSYPFMQYYFGTNGSLLAWQYGKWESAEHFIRVQIKWETWAIGIYFGAIILAIILVLLSVFGPL